MNLEVPILQGSKSTEFLQFLNLNVSTAFLGKIAKNIQFGGFSLPGYIGDEMLPCYMGIIRNL